MTEHETVLMFWLWAANNFGWTMPETDAMPLCELINLYVLNYKMENPNDFRPAEFYF